MPLSNAEKCKRRREKIRQDDNMYKQHLQKDRQRKRRARAKRMKNMTKNELNEHRAFAVQSVQTKMVAKQKAGLKMTPLAHQIIQIQQHRTRLLKL